MDAGSQILGRRVEAEAPVDTGALAGSVEVKPVRRRKGTLVQEVVVTGGHDHPTVAQVEYGTMHEEPNPFFRRAIAGTEAERIRKIESAVD